jgi:two-component system, NarL family, nitrate/nitrite response regulator NarL
MGSVNINAIRILIVDDHALVRTALGMLLESRPGLKVVGEGACLEEALAVATREQPDIILLELALGAANGLDLLPQLHTAAPGSHIIVLTGVRDPALHRRAVRLGAVGLVLKEDPAAVLLEAIAKVSAGEVWLDSLLVASVLGEMTRARTSKPIDPEEVKIKTLTAREREIIELIGQGWRNQAIADHLYLSEATVRHHLTSIFAKLEVGDRLELAIYAHRHGLACLLPQRYGH